MATNDWTTDELILVLDVYVREGRQNKTSPHIRELVKLIHALPCYADQEEPPRSASAIAMRHSNFAAIDPAFPSKGLDGISGNARVVYDYYATRPDELATVAAAIRASISEGLIEDLSESDDAERTALEGEPLIRLHRGRERNRRIVQQRKSAQREDLGHLECEICEVTEADFAERYGLPDGDLFECHHRVPLSEATGARRTSIDDLAVVCPTCHRALHRHARLPTVEEQRRILSS